MERYKKLYAIAGIFLVSFLLWTTAVCFVDVQAIGPRNSSVGFATINGFFHELTGVHLDLYLLTDGLSIIPLGICIGFGILGLIQWIQRKSLFRVDHDILTLGVFYLIVMAAFVFFETVIINYRPVLINGVLEASYPSSTTMLVLCVMLTALSQFRARVKNNAMRRGGTLFLAVFTAFMIIGRLLSGVHWLSDIIGGTLLSAGLILMYEGSVSLVRFCFVKKQL